MSSMTPRLSNVCYYPLWMKYHSIIGPSRRDSSVVNSVRDFQLNSVGILLVPVFGRSFSLITHVSGTPSLLKS